MLWVQKLLLISLRRSVLWVCAHMTHAHTPRYLSAAFIYMHFMLLCRTTIMFFINFVFFYPIFFASEGLPPRDATRTEVTNIVNGAVTDRELQAHALQMMKDQLGMEFDRRLNPNMPEPSYYKRQEDS